VRLTNRIIHVNPQAILQIESVSFSHPVPNGTPVPALHGVSLTLREGEFTVVLGANGSGKSTLLRLMNALLLPDSGKVLVAGLNTREPHNLGKIRSMVGMVFQSPEEQIIATSVEEDIAFGPENLGLPSTEIRRRVEEALQTVGLESERSRPPHLLSAGQMQRLALAGALAMQPPLMLFDEPTTMIDPAGRRMLMEQIHTLKSVGVTVVLITHHMDEAAQADRVIVLREGRLELDGTPRQIFSSAALETYGLELPPAEVFGEALRPLIPRLHPHIYTLEMMLEELRGIHPPRGVKTVLPHRSEIPVRNEAIIRVEGLGFTYMKDTPMSHRALENTSLRVGQGEAHGLIGATGSGKTTLLQHLNGLLKPQEGTVRVGAFDLNDPGVGVRQLCSLAGLIFQNPEVQFFEQYVGDEIAYGAKQLKLAGNLRERVRGAMDSVGLDFETYKDRFTWTLSGGEKRRVALASILSLDPQILLLDEPTAGLDPLTRRAIIRHLQELHRRGKTLVLSSHRMGDIARVTDHTTVMQNGTSILAGTTGEVFGRGDTLLAAGLEPPLSAQAAVIMRANGWPLPEGITGQEELITALKACLGRGA
jgi:energy-coupling factor transport system ATP-binding protein